MTNAGPATFTTTAKPAIKGTAVVGQKLTVSAGTYSVGGVTVKYQWLRNGAAISGATGTSYTATATDLSKSLSVKVTASKTGYTTVTSTTAATKVAAGTFTVKAKPAIKGTAAVGKVLSVSAGTYSVSGVTVKYQWLRNGATIKGATTHKYTATAADKKTSLSVRVTAAKTGYKIVTTVTAKTSSVR